MSDPIEVLMHVDSMGVRTLSGDVETNDMGAPRHWIAECYANSGKHKYAATFELPDGKHTWDIGDMIRADQIELKGVTFSPREWLEQDCYMTIGVRDDWHGYPSRLYSPGDV